MSMQQVIERAMADPAFAEGLKTDFRGTVNQAGITVSEDEVKSFVGLPGASHEEAVEALEQRVSHASFLWHSVPQMVPPET
jgi:hypothetical protein